MIFNRIIYDGFGRRYKLHLLGDGPIPKHIKPKSFYDETFTISFLQSMRVSESYWRQLSYELVGSLPYTANPRDYLDAIARLFIQGRIQLFEISESNTGQYPIEKRSFKQPDGRIYRFISPTEKLIDPTKKTKKFHSRKEAVEFVKKLSPEQESIRDIARAFNLSSPFSKQEKDQEVLYTSIGDMVFDERVLIVSEEPRKPPVSEPVYEDIYIKTIPLAPPRQPNDYPPKLDYIKILNKGGNSVYLEEDSSQYVNLPRDNKWTLCGEPIAIDRCSTKLRVEVFFNIPGNHEFYLTLKCGKKNVSYSSEKEHKYIVEEKTKAFNTSGQKSIVIDEFHTSVAGLDKFWFEAVYKEKKEISEIITNQRVIYYTEIEMENRSSPTPDDIGIVEAEYAVKYGIIFDKVGNRIKIKKKSIGYDSDSPDGKYHGHYEKIKNSISNIIKDKYSPYLLSVAYVDDIIELYPLDENPYYQTYYPMKNTAFHLHSVVDENCNPQRHIPVDRNISSYITDARCYSDKNDSIGTPISPTRFSPFILKLPDEDHKSSMSLVIDLQGLNINMGNNGIQNGYISFVCQYITGNLSGVTVRIKKNIDIAAHSYYKNLTTEEQLRTLFHELGHALNITHRRELTDNPDNHLTASIGHCPSKDLNNNPCIMAEGGSTRKKSLDFCPYCEEAARKMDLSNPFDLSSHPSI